LIDLTTLDGRKAISAVYASKYGLDPQIVAAVCEQESAWNSWAMRYEPGFYSRYIVPMALKDSTEATARAISFGLMQVMGEVAREFGFEGRFLSELCDPDVGMDFGCKKLQKCFSVHGDADTALLAYNGGGNLAYGEEVLARVSAYA
jgi:soluble lytic murein transglycosylase-like protein